MLISRLVRGRLSSSVRTLLREISSPSYQIAEHVGLRSEGVKRGFCAYQLLCSNTGRKHQVQKIVGLTFASSSLVIWNGSTEVTNCEQGDVGKVIPALPQTVIKVEEKKDSRVVIVLKYLWLPSMALFTVVTGYYFPSSLAITVALLLWSTKPKANSIYDWVEKRRLEEAIEKQRIERIGFNFNIKATVMHVEVRDYTLICLAQVTSMTQNATLVGFLGGWFVIYSSSSTITALGLRSLFPDTFPTLKKYLDRFDSDSVREHSVTER